MKRTNLNLIMRVLVAVMLIVLCLLAVLSLAPATRVTAQNPRTKISAPVLAGVADGKTASVVVMLSDQADLSALPVAHLSNGSLPQAEERYTCDGGGTLTVGISNLTAGYDRQYRLGRWAAPEKPVVPARPGRRRKRPPAT